MQNISEATLVAFLSLESPSLLKKCFLFFHGSKVQITWISLISFIYIVMPIDALTLSDFKNVFSMKKETK